MKLSLLIVSLALLLTACSDPKTRAAEPQLSWELAGYGAVSLQPDNILRLCNGRGIAQITADGIYSGSSYADLPEPRLGERHLSDLLLQQECNQMLAATDDYYLATAGDQGWLVPRSTQGPVISLAMPPGMDNGPHGYLSDNFDKCMVGGRPVVLYDGQFAQAYDVKGEPLWQFAGDESSYLLPSADGERLLLASRNGSLYCLNHEGQLLWQRRGCFQTVSMGDRIIMLDSAGNILCLSWDAEELWQHGLAPADYTYLLTVPSSPLCVIRNGLELSALDRAGALLWQRTLPENDSGTMYISPDGYLFFWIIHWVPQNSLLGRRYETGISHDSVWTCIDPAGNDLWASTNMPSHNGNFLPGYGGRLYIYMRKQDELRCYDPPAHGDS